MGELRQSRLRDDLLGGLVSASLAIPLAMGYGMFAFTALGDSYFAYGALAGLYAAIVAGVVCVALGDRTTTIYAPRITTNFLIGALVYDLVHSDVGVLRGGNVHLIVLAFFSIIFLGGLFQAIFGLVRLGSLIRFTPHPVLAGLQNAAAAILFLVQLGDVCGFDHNIPYNAVFSHLAEIKPLSLAVAFITFIAMWKARVITTRILPPLAGVGALLDFSLVLTGFGARLGPAVGMAMSKARLTSAKIPPLLVGLSIGTLLYFVLVLAGFGAQLGPVIGMPAAVESPTPYRALGDLPGPSDLAELLPLIVRYGFTLALVAAIDALLCAKLTTPAGANKVDGDRLLIRLGAGNMLSACFGGITSGINIGPSLTNRAFGARTSLSVLVNAATLLLMSSVLFPVVSYIPRVVLSATIMVIAVQHVDPWSIDLVGRIRTSASRHRGAMLLDLSVVALVAALSIAVNIVLAILLGIGIAVAMFIVRMSRSNIRRRYNCETIRSRKARTPQEAALLEKRGKDILVFELQGVLFFGSAETLGEEIERASAAGLRSIILDLRHVTDIDATGARILVDIQASLARKDQRLVLAVCKANQISTRLLEAGVFEAIGAGCVFEDIDRAMEWAEDELIHPHTRAYESDEIPLARVDLLATLTSAELAALERNTRRETFPRGKFIFREGDPSKELFIVTKGGASAYLHQSNGENIRLATFARGTIFGELAILDTGRRSVSVIADDDVICYVLSDRQFAALANDTPALAIKLLSGLGRQLSKRLRRANQTIYQLET